MVTSPRSIPCPSLFWETDSHGLHQSPAFRLLIEWSQRDSPADDRRMGGERGPAESSLTRPQFVPLSVATDPGRWPLSCSNSCLPGSFRPSSSTTALPWASLSHVGFRSSAHTPIDSSASISLLSIKRASEACWDP